MNVATRTQWVIAVYKFKLWRVHVEQVINMYDILSRYVGSETMWWLTNVFGIHYVIRYVKST